MWKTVEIKIRKIEIAENKERRTKERDRIKVRRKRTVKEEEKESKKWMIEVKKIVKEWEM